ncbi:MAG: FkbM family methyltransferase [Sphingomonadales bacterium]|jgi:hypothetical protein
MLAKVYRWILPAGFRRIIYDVFLGRILKFVRNFSMNFRCKFTFIFQYFLPKTDLNKALAFMGRYGLTSYPSAYMLEYRNMQVEIQFDADKKLHYCLHNGRKLYFTSEFTKDRIIKLYRSLVIEQNVRSAHRYIEDYNALEGYVLLDVGSAEGIFTLDNIDRIKHAYLFEAEPYWIDALRATFEPWKDKVTIVEKYVGNKTQDNFTTLDDFLQDRNFDKVFLKMDIEGAELEALQGAGSTMKNSPEMRVAVCTYHRPGDPERFEGLLKENGFQTSFSEGYLFWGKRLSKAVIRGVKGV